MLLLSGVNVGMFLVKRGIFQKIFLFNLFFYIYYFKNKYLINKINLYK